MAVKENPDMNCQSTGSLQRAPRGTETCPLCGAPMLARKRDPLVRMFGFVVLYGSIFALLLFLPNIGIYEALAFGIIAAWGVVLMRSSPTWWCRECWFEMPRREPHASSMATVPGSGRDSH